jgi:hypothetical protein
MRSSINIFESRHDLVMEALSGVVWGYLDEHWLNKRGKKKKSENKEYFKQLLGEEWTIDLRKKSSK